MLRQFVDFRMVFRAINVPISFGAIYAIFGRSRSVLTHLLPPPILPYVSVLALWRACAVTFDPNSFSFWLYFTAALCFACARDQVRLELAFNLSVTTFNSLCSCWLSSSAFERRCPTGSFLLFQALGWIFPRFGGIDGAPSDSEAQKDVRLRSHLNRRPVVPIITAGFDSWYSL